MESDKDDVLPALDEDEYKLLSPFEQKIYRVLEKVCRPSKSGREGRLKDG